MRLRARLTHLGDLSTLVTRARRLFDLDADPIAVDEALARHPELAPLVARVPGIRVPGAADPHEMLIRAMVGQQITVTAARTALTALADALGERVEIGFDGSRKPAVPHDGRDRRARARGAARTRRPHPGDHRRGRSARRRHAALGPGDDAADQRAALLAMPGIGPWTADYVRMRVIGDPDVFLPGDVAVRTGAAAVGLPAEARALEQWAARTAPWRTYLTAHLWRAVPPRPPRAGSVVGSTVPPPHPSPDITPAPPVRRPSTEETPK